MYEWVCAFDDCHSDIWTDSHRGSSSRRTSQFPSVRRRQQETDLRASLKKGGPLQS